VQVACAGRRRAGRGGPAAGPNVRTSELRAVARVALENLGKQLTEAAPKATDPATQAHLKDLAAEINELLEGGKKK